MLCLIILTFKHEKKLLVRLKCIHDLQKKKHTKKIQRNKNTKKNKIFMKVEYL